MKKWIIIFALLIATPIFAATIDDLKAQIDQKNSQISDIQKEIDQFQQEINKNASQATNLKNQISQLELQKKKLQKDISLTQKQIENAKLNIEELGLQINVKENDIADKISVLTELVKNMKDSESTSMVELMLSQENLSGFYNDLAQMENFQGEINDNLAELKDLKTSLETEKSGQEKQKKNLEQFKSKLSDQKQLVEINKSSKNQLLTETKNKQSNYQKLLDEKMRFKDAMEREIDDLESKINIQINPNTLPHTGSGVLSWPFTEQKMTDCKKFTDLKNIYCITQYFGNTPFATANPQLYKTGEHKGLDFRAPVGTEILAADSGTVLGAGDTDITVDDGTAYTPVATTLTAAI
ncbi:MAG: hypothetical protein NTX55_01815, partial [Candidatus Parcubacteria bacterium]|nr:hypothetical protein [Candidatus Parcubacteria bacterium]